MSINITIQFPSPALVPGRARKTLRDTVNNATRPPFRRGVSDLQRVGRYPAISDYWLFQQETVADGSSYSLQNRHPAARYLIPGTRPHDIHMPPHHAPVDALIAWALELGLPIGVAYAALAKIAREGQVMHHPGVAPDLPVQQVLDRTQQEALSRLSVYYGRWLAEWGQGTVGE